MKPGLGSLIVAGQKSLTPWQFRRALEQSAIYPKMSEYDPTELRDRSVPIIDAAPYVQTGWGLLSPDPEFGIVPEALAHLGLAGRPTRTKSADACSFNTRQVDFRFAYWKHMAHTSSFQREENPYVYC